MIFTAEVSTQSSGPPVARPAGTTAGVGFHLEPDPTHLYPLPSWPVTVRAYRQDDVTYDDHVMRGPGARWVGEGFRRLEFYGPAHTKWLVTTYTTVADWEERDTRYSTYQDTNPGGGPVLRAVPAMLSTTDTGGVISGLRHLTSTVGNVPRLASGIGGYAMPLRTDGDGRLLVAPPPPAPVEPAVVEPTLLNSGVATGTTATTHLLLPSAVPALAYRTLWLRIYGANVGGGGTVTPIIRSFAGGGGTALAEYEGPAVAHMAAGEVQVGPGLAAATVGGTRIYGARILRMQPLLKLSGTTSFNVNWELWAER